MHDRSGKKGVDKVRFYLDRFVLFSKNFPYQKVSAELLRKYMVNGMPKNRKEFKDAHIQLGGGNCFMVTAVEDYCDPATLPTLRLFRDEKLLKSSSGRIFVKVYYKIGPNLARLLLRTPESVQRSAAKFFDRLSKKLVK